MATTNYNINDITRLPDNSTRYQQDSEIIDTVNANNVIVDTALQGLETSKLTKTGDAKDTTVTFIEATERTNILTTDKMSNLLGKIKKWFTDLKTIAFSGHAKDASITDTNSKFTSENVDGALDEIGTTLEQKADKAFKAPTTGYRNGYIKLFEMNKSVGAYYYATIVQGGISNLTDILEIAVEGETISNTIVYRKSSAFQSSKSNIEIYDDGTKYVGYLKATQYSHIPTVNIDGINLCTVINTVVTLAPTGTKVYDSTVSEKTIATTDKIDNLFESGIWTPTIQGETSVGTITYSIQEGKYIRTNKLIKCTFFIRASITGADGKLYLSSLPVVPKNLYESGIISHAKIATNNLLFGSFCNASSKHNFLIYKTDKSYAQGTDLNGLGVFDIVGTVEYEIA